MSPYITTKNKYAAERSHNMAALHVKATLMTNVSLLCIAALGAVVYLVMLNVLVADGYAVKALEKKLQGMQREQEQLEATLAGFQTPTILREKTASLGLVAIENAAYAKPEPAVALGGGR